MRRKFLKGAPDDDDAVVDAFVHHNRESALKTKPKVCRFLLSIAPSLQCGVYCPLRRIFLLRSFVLCFGCIVSCSFIIYGLGREILVAGNTRSPSMFHRWSDRGWFWERKSLPSSCVQGLCPSGNGPMRSWRPDLSGPRDSLVGLLGATTAPPEDGRDLAHDDSKNPRVSTSVPSSSNQTKEMWRTGLRERPSRFRPVFPNRNHGTRAIWLISMGESHLLEGDLLSRRRVWFHGSLMRQAPRLIHG